MFKKLKKILSVVLSIIVVSSMIGCSSGNADKKGEKETPTGKPDYSYSTEQFMIGGWMPPMVTDEQYKWIAESGLNMIFLNGSYVNGRNKDKVLEALSYCDKYGVKAYVSKPDSTAALYDDGAEYSEHKSFGGFCMKDEPTIDEISGLSGYVTNYKANLPNSDFFVNLFPSYAASAAIGNDYADYLDEYASQILDRFDEDKRWLSMDYYPLVYNTKGEKDLWNTWLFNLATTANVATEHKAKPHFFIQSMPFHGASSDEHNRIPTSQDLSLQIYTCLAFGAKGFSHFCYQSPSLSYEFTEDQTAMIDRNNQKTEMYGMAQSINKEVLKFGKVLTSFNWLGVLGIQGSESSSGRGAQILNIPNAINETDLYEIKSIETTQDLLIGNFLDKDGYSGYVLVNFGEPSKIKTSSVNIDFYSANKALVWENGEQSDSILDGNKLNLSLAPGEGVFIIPYKN